MSPMSKLEESQALHHRGKAFVAAFEAGLPMPESFDALACDLASFQGYHVEGYARLLHARGKRAGEFRFAIDAPAVPTEAFKLARVSAFSPEETPLVFRTSGTTIGARGAHYFRDVSTYDAGALAFGRWGLIPGHEKNERAAVLVVGPSSTEAPDSSLAHMLSLFARDFGDGHFFMEEDVLDIAALDEHVAKELVARRPVLLLGTSFAFVHLLDAAGDAGFRLPAGSRVMQTGGFKGKSREIAPDVLRSELATAFAIDESSIVSEYGMTELSSQFYDAPGSGGKAAVYVEPPWARVVPVDPATLEPVALGEIGIARIEDLLNVDSAFAVLAADRVRRVEGGFELLGRLPGAPPRGCSIAVDEILGRT
ncbi:MAG: acyl-protein synthetase [Polyangiaceae bacterium]